MRPSRRKNITENARSGTEGVKERRKVLSFGSELSRRISAEKFYRLCGLDARKNEMDSPLKTPSPSEMPLQGCSARDGNFRVAFPWVRGVGGFKEHWPGRLGSRPATCGKTGAVRAPLSESFRQNLSKEHSTPSESLNDLYVPFSISRTVFFALPSAVFLMRA